jgi:hypothetical protein
MDSSRPMKQGMWLIRIFPSWGSEDATRVPRVTILIFLAVSLLGVAAALRLVFLNWGLPYIYHPDEPINMVILHRMIAESDLNPGFFRYPSLLYYLNLPGQYFVKWWDGGLLPFTMQSMGNGFTEQPEAFRVARITTLLFGLAILPVLIIWARTILVGMAGFLMLGAVFCLNPLLLRCSTYIAPDILAAFFTTSALFASTLIVVRGNRSAYILAGVLAGLAASSKYNAGLVAVAIPAAYLTREGLAAAKLPLLVIAAVTTGLAFLLSSPFLIVHPRFAAHEILFEILHYSKLGNAGAEGHSLAANSAWVVDNFGWAGLLAIAASFSPRVRTLIPAMVFVVAYFLLLIVQYVHFERNLLPLIPAVVLLIAVGVDSITRVLASTLPNVGRVTSAIFVVLALALFTRPAMLSLTELVNYNNDPRAEARVWANEQLPTTPARAIAVDPFAPYIADNGRTVTGSYYSIAEMDRAALAPFSYLVLSRKGSGRFLQGPHDSERAKLADLKANSCDYRQFPANTAEPEYLILILKCGAGK